ncbi:MAG: hypothetical protein J4473_04230 [Candidatus Aenigmarchaeota archaeon]|nr:hypothetical protein [Candidatus Aenigmarchaeota archaeon]
MKKKGFIKATGRVEEVSFELTASVEPSLMKFFLNERQIDSLKEMKNKKSITPQMYMKMFNVSYEQSLKELLELADEGLINKAENVFRFLGEEEEEE